MRLTFKARSRKKEIMDLKECSLQEYEECLAKLGKIGTLLGAQKSMLSQILNIAKKHNLHHVRILDVGCGGGDLAVFLAKKLPTSSVVGIDIDQDAIAFAQDRWKNVKNVQFEKSDLGEQKAKSFDIVITNLVCHHLLDDEMKKFIQIALSIAKYTFIINDLHRHKMAYFFFALISPILFYNRLILHDGLLSIKRGFVHRDWIELLSCFTKARWMRKWPFRWIVRIDV